MRIAADRLATKRWIRQRIALYARRTSLGYKPLVTFSMEEWANRSLPYTRGDMQDAMMKGMANPTFKAIMVNPDKECCRKDADDTLAHEVAHLRWPSSPHSKLFYRRVDAIRAGKRCGPPRTRLPAAFR